MYQKCENYLKQSEIIAKAYKIKFYAGKIIKIYVKKGFFALVCAGSRIFYTPDSLKTTIILRCFIKYGYICKEAAWLSCCRQCRPCSFSIRIV